MLKQNERFDQLIKENFSIIQNDDVFSFSTDALLLGHFTNPRAKDKVLDLCSGNGVITFTIIRKTSPSNRGYRNSRNSRRYGATHISI